MVVHCKCDVCGVMCGVDSLDYIQHWEPMTPDVPPTLPDGSPNPDFDGSPNYSKGPLATYCTTHECEFLPDLNPKTMLRDIPNPKYNPEGVAAVIREKVLSAPHLKKTTQA